MEGRKRSGEGFRKMIASKLCCFNLSEPVEEKRQLCCEEKFELSTTTCLNRNTPGSAVMPVDKDDEEYKMSHQNRGFAIILNHDKFDSKKLGNRRGSQHDVDRLKNTLENKLGFDVIVHKNLTKAEIIGVLKRVSEEDHTNNDCLLLVCMTHGDVGNQLSARDSYYSVEELWLPFMANVCPTLAGKPKLFFIQACRGKLLDAGVNMIPFRQNDSFNKTDTTKHAHKEYKIPKRSDILVMYATTHGYVAFRTESGSPFIRSLCEQLEKKAFTEELMTILTSVIREVSTEYESDCAGVEDLDYKKCSPEITNNTLMRAVKFSRKSVDNEIATYSGSVA